MLTDFCLIQANLRNGFGPASAVRAGFEKNGHFRLRQGIVPIDNVLPSTTSKRNLSRCWSEGICALLKSVKSSTHGIPSSILLPLDERPFPWDWLVVAQKTTD